MKHYGDITKINGAEIEPVDVITGGSPCQDLSIAGKRAGLAGERSGLFMEQIRIVKEMREKEIANGRTDCAIRPRFLVWENVPGAFTSNGGKDFQAVLTEIVRIVEPNAPDVPMPDGGRWSKSGCLYGEMGDWSIAWRVHDAQFWGVPQRRKRIALVADFGGCAAPEVLFERKGVSRDTEQGESAGKGTAGDSSQSVGAAISFQERAGKPGGWIGMHDKVGALNCMHDQQAVMCYGLDRASYNQGKNAQFDFTVTENQQPTLTAKGPGAVCDYYVRRLTPTECERLQGYPDGWTNIGEWTDSKGKKHQTADSARYKALGNSIALPFWKVLARRISAQYDRDITMGSLFDGIGGFPLAFEHCGGKAVWASEIEEFPIAVTKVRFKE